MITTKRLENYVRQAKAEARLFRKTRKLIYLEQAAEKTYNAYILLLERIYNISIIHHKDVSKIMRRSRDKDIIELGTVANSLHIMFYESGDEFFIRRNLQKAWSLIGRIKKRRNL